MKKIILILSIIFSAQTHSDDLFDNLLSNLGAPLSEIGFNKKLTRSSDGVEIVYYEKGTGNKTLLFIHGYGCNSKYWWAQLQHFSKNYRVISIDIGGHGESGTNRNDYTMANFGGDVVAVMNEENIKQSYLIGHSMGGPVALEAAVVLQDRVTAIIGVDTFHNIAKGPASPFVKLMVNTMFRFRQSSSTNDAVTKQFREDANLDLKNWVSQKAETTDPRASRGSLSSIIAMDYPTQLKKINVPIITLNSRFWMDTEVEEGHKEYSKYEVSFIDEVGHYVMMEKPTYFNKWLDGVLDERTIN
jgi:pimeloyl-ACP methyl ester carboxylesterase|tara:strand:- start:521 stop:1423 length:903 start_codon:yes stop_codon:yes gene_type:complete